MRWIRALLSRCSGLFRKSQAEDEISREIASNIELHIEENIRSGMTPQEARRDALVRFGSVDSAKEAWRDRRGIPFLEEVGRDVRYAARLLLRNKGWTAVAVLSLALGIGVNTALFSVIRSVALATLPAQNPDELVAFRWINQSQLPVTMMIGYGHIETGSDEQAMGGSFSYPVFERLSAVNQTLTDVFAFATFSPRSVVANGETGAASAEFVSGNLYRALGVTPFRGRLIEPGDDATDARPVAVLSHRYWQQRFGMAPDAIGSTVTLNGVGLTVVGIKPPELGLLTRIGEDPADISIPLRLEPVIHSRESTLNTSSAWWIILMGRRRSGVTLEQVQANLEVAYQQVVRDDAKALGNSSIEPFIPPRLVVVPGKRGVFDLSPRFSRPLPVFGAVFVIVLLTACINVVNLLLALSATREREIAVRIAIGATRGRLIRQLLTESLLVAFIGGTASMAVAYSTSKFFPVAMADHARLDWNAFAFAAAIALLGGILFGMAPARHTDRIATHFSGSGSRLAKSLVISQVAMAFVLLMGAGLFLRTLDNLQRVSLGFNANNLLTFDLSGGRTRYDLYEQILEGLNAVPGVQASTFTDRPLATGRGTYIFNISGNGVNHVDEGLFQLFVHQSFFETLQLPLKLGRGFTRDDRSGPKVAVVNESFARKFFPNSSPLGGYLNASESPEGLTAIVGVVADAIERLREPAAPTVFLPASQRDGWPFNTFEVRTLGAPETVLPQIREVIRKIDSRKTVSDVSTQMAAFERGWAEERTYAVTSTFFGALTLSLSMIGLFGLMLYTVIRRSKEIGIRMALGAQRWEILYSVMRETLTLVGIGLVIGLVGAAALTRYIESLLFGVTSHDMATVVTVLCVMVLVAVVAAGVPARRASRLDPLMVLKHE